MEIYHLAVLTKFPDWTIAKTADVFNVSIGLVSENLKLALAMHTDHNLHRCESRQQALKKVKGKMNGTYTTYQE